VSHGINHRIPFRLARMNGIATMEVFLHDCRVECVNSELYVMRLDPERVEPPYSGCHAANKAIWYLITVTASVT